jgi:hypothetical protein
MDKIGIIIQGTSTSKPQLSDIYNSYISQGYHTVVSSYSEYIDTNIITNYVDNDDILGTLTVKPKGRHNPNANYQIITTQRGLDYFSSYPEIKYILKIRADMEINNLNEVLKKWVELVDSSISPEYSPLSKKLLTLGRCLRGEKNPWYISDYFNFGLKTDQNIYWDIPLLPINKVQSKRVEEYISSAFLNHNPLGKAKDYFIFTPSVASYIYSYKWKSDLTISSARDNI